MDETELESAPNLSHWLITSSARLSTATSREDVLASTLAALRELGAPVAALWGHGDTPPDTSADTAIVSAGSDTSKVYAALNIDLCPLEAPAHLAVIELLSIAALHLEQRPNPRERHSVHHAAATLDDLQTALENSDDRPTILEAILDHACHIFSPSAAAIIRDTPVQILHARDHHVIEADGGAAISMHSIAAEMLDAIQTSDNEVIEREILLDDQHNLHALCLRIANDDSGTLALLLCYEDVPRAQRDAYTAPLRELSERLRSSAHVQTILTGNRVNHEFLRALNNATLAAASTHDLPQLYEAVKDALSRVMPTDAMLIAVIPEGHDEAVTVFRSEGDQSYFDVAPLSHSFQTGMQLGRPFIVEEVPDTLNYPHYRFGDPTRRVKSLAAAPLTANGRITGLIVTQSYEVSAFRVEQADLLLDIGTSIAAALERAQLVDRLKRRSAREAAMRTLTQKLSTTLDIPEILNLVASEVAGVMDDCLVVATHTETIVIPERHIVAAAGPDQLKRDLGVSSDGSITPDSVADQIVRASRAQTILSDGLSIVAVPLHDGSTCIGTLIFARRSRLPFSADEHSMFAILEGIAASALRNAILYRARARDEADLVEVERISRLVASSLETDSILAEILASLPALFQSEGCSVRVVHDKHLVPLAVHGEIVHSFADRVPIDTSLAGTIVRDKRLLAVDDLHSHPAAGRHARRTGVKVRGWLAAPMIDAEGEVFGILSIHSDFPRHWTERDRVLLQTLAESTTVAIQNAWRFSRTRDTLLASVESLANAVDAKDPTTLNHSRNVSIYARRIAEAMRLDTSDIENVALAGLLHDIGKIGIPDRILQKPDVLNRSEWERMQTHPEIGEQILSGNSHLAPVLPYVRHHHERWDGMGYPDKLKGDAIPLGAAIVAIADAVDTMSSERPYRRALPWQYVSQVVREESGKQFHPDVAQHFLDLAESGELGPMRDESDLRVALQTGIRSPGMSLDARALMIFHGVAREIRALTNLETFIANVTEVIRSVMEMSDIQIFLVDEEADEFYYQPSEGDRLRGFREMRRRVGTGVVGWVIEHAEPLLVPDVSQDERFIHAAVTDVRSEVAVPLLVDGTVIGAINVESSIVAAFSEADIRLLTVTAAHLSQVIQVARLHNQFKQHASTDALTGLANHRAFYERLDEEIRHAAITDGLLTVAIMDVDNLKTINDTYGHLAGDEMLRQMATVLKERCRRSDHVARYGGDEFAFILTDTDLQGAELALSHLIEGLAERSVTINGHSIPLSTGAWGLSSYPEDGVRPAELVRVADQRMYSNKFIAKTFRTDASVPEVSTGTSV